MAKRSAGILVFKRVQHGDIRVLLVHPGGPFWAKKDLGAWSIPKGEFNDGEAALATARRELVEELGPAAQPLADFADHAFVPLGEIKQKGGKVVTAFALQADFDVARLASNMFELEWPPRSGRKTSFPEVDRAEWFSLDQAQEKILVSQTGFVTAIAQLARRFNDDHESR
jgi:predicted NUDIX family NTP pyrophosphohydrolase